MSILEKIKKHSTINDTALLSESKFFHEKDMVPTPIPILNIALSGSLDGGLSPGITMFAGPSKHFKTMFSLILAQSYLDKYPESALLFYDSEFGTPTEYFESMNIAPERVVHTPITDIEQLKFDIMQQITNLERGDKLIIVIDSIGNLASKKEVEDTLEQKTAADMTRAKQLKSLFRMITPHLVLKDIPLIAINHTYKSMDFYSKDIVGGGTGSIYAASNIFIIGRQQEKDGADISGWNFIINVEKSRYTKEKSKFPVTVRYNKGLSKYSGLMDMALEAKVVIQPSPRTYSRVNTETGEIEDKKWKLTDTDNSEFWDSVLSNQTFKDWVIASFKSSSEMNMVVNDEA